MLGVDCDGDDYTSYPFPSISPSLNPPFSSSRRPLAGFALQARMWYFRNTFETV
jgi:hypothetical protein